MRRAAAMILALCAAACISATPRERWSGEVKNSSARLSRAQRRSLESKSAQLRVRGRALAPALRTLALLLDDPKSAANARQAAANAVADALGDIVRGDPAMTSLLFTTGDYLSAAVATRTGSKVDAHADLGVQEPGLRGQIGFFPEGPRTPIEDLRGYPKSQYAVATSNAGRMRIRVPVISDGFYLGDLIAEYASGR